MNAIYGVVGKKYRTFTCWI